MEKKFELPKAFAEKWVKALRSGEYKQGHHVLFRNDFQSCEYCCIGIAGIVAGVKESRMLNKNLFGTQSHNDVQSFKIPKELRTIENAGRYQLPLLISRMNDNGSSFIEIADWIEANVKFVPENLTDPSTQSKIEQSYNEHLKNQ